MRTADAMAALATVMPDVDGVSSELGRKGETACLRLSSETATERWAVVSSPGDRWFSLDVDGGFSLDYFEEDTPDDEVRRILERLVQLAVEYLVHQPTPLKAGLLGLPVIRLASPQGEVVLRRSLLGSLGSLLGMSGQA